MMGGLHFEFAAPRLLCYSVGAAFAELSDFLSEGAGSGRIDFFVPFAWGMGT